MNQATLNRKRTSFLALISAFALLPSLCAYADTPPTYTLSVSGGSFNPSPLVVDDTQPSPGTVTATASVSGSVVVTNPNDEYQENNDDQWNYSPYISGFSSTKNGSYGSTSGITPPSVSGGSSGMITATANQNTTPGYYQITVTASDQFTVKDSDTNPASTITENPAPASTTIYLTVAAVSLSNGDAWVMVGEEWVISASVQPSDLIPSPAPAGTFTWNVGGYAIGGYDTSNNTQYANGNPNQPVPGSATYSVGTTLPLTLNTQSIAFYWVDDGTKTVSCSISGLSCSPSAKFTVMRPTGASVQTQPGMVELHNSGGQYFLKAGGAANNIGILFTFTVPAIGGSWEWIQLVESTSRTVTEADGHTAKINVNGLPVLDTNLPYDFVANGSSTNDNPGEDVNPFSLNPASPSSLSSTLLNDVVSASDSDTFKDWLMYMPPTNNSIWVPIGTVGWSWNGSASMQKDKNGNYTGNWLPALGSPAGAVTVTQQYQDEKHAFPEWNNNVIDGYYTLQ